MAGGEWYHADNGKQVGPMSLEDLAARVASLGLNTLIYGPGLTQWTEARHVSAVASRLAEVRVTVPPSIPPSRSRSHEIDYEVFGHEMQYVEIGLDPGETVIAEAGAMMYMTTGVQMQTVFGDPSSESSGLLGKLKTAGKRVLTGESLFMTTYTAQTGGKQTVAFAAPYPGKILPIQLSRHGGELICQKDSFLCAAKGVQVSIAFQKKIGVAIFGGEGFIMQRLLGDGITMIHAGGTVVEKTLQQGETIKIDTGCLVALEKTVDYDIQMVGGFKNTIFGGEGLFLATLTGPGKVWLQSLPFSRLAGRVLANAKGMGGKGEGSLLGGVGLGGLLGRSE